MAELADAQDLESCGQPCRFDSCYPHQKRIKRTLMKSQSSFFLYKRLFRLDAQVKIVKNSMLKAEVNLRLLHHFNSSYLKSLFLIKSL